MINISLENTPVNDCLKLALEAELKRSDFKVETVMAIMVPSGLLVTTTLFVKMEDVKF